MTKSPPRSNEKGIALLMVTTAITLLSVLMINFSYDTSVNKLKAWNAQDTSIAKLNAQAGLEFALIRLRLYKEAFNFRENNQSVKDNVPAEVLNSLWDFPFVYPLPITPGMNQIQKNAIEDFMDSTILEGEIQLEIQNISNRVNINLFRVGMIAKATEESSQNNNSSSIETESENKNKVGEDDDYNLDNQFIRALVGAVERKSADDEEFSSRYLGLDPSLYVNSVKYYLQDFGLNDRNTLGENLYLQEQLAPRFAPMASRSEMYALAQWDDDLVELVLSDYTPYGAVMIDLNKLTEKMLRVLIPNLEDEDIQRYFEYKNDPEGPVTFNKVDEFKQYWVETANVITREDFDKVISKYQSQGVQFGPSPTLFKVIATGKKNRSTFNLVAYILLAAQPVPKKATHQSNSSANSTESGSDGEDEGEENENESTSNTGNETKKEQKTQLLNPRVVEIFVN